MKRTLAILLAVIMIISALPVMAFAAGTTISFETTFTDEMVVGDTFTVVAKLEGNPTFGTMTLDLNWNEDVLSFQGFDANARGVLTSEVFNTAGGYAAPVINQEKGILTCADALGYDLNGVLFTANFEIVGSGELGLCFNEDKYEFKNLDGSADVDATIDYAAIENLSVAGAEPDGPAIPEGAPFTAVTTDAGAAIAIEQQENVSFNYADVPYYIVTIPADATTVYVTDPNQYVTKDYTSGEMMASAYAADIDSGWSTLYVNYDYTEVADGIQVTIPLNMTAEDWSAGTVEMCFVDDGNGSLTHAYGSENSSFACTFLMSFKYASSSTPEEPEEPTVSEIPAGAAFVDMIAKVNGEDKPVTIEVLDDHYKVLVPLGTTSVWVVYDEGVPVVDEFGYAAVRVTGVDGVTEDGYSQTTSGGKTTVGLLMNKAAANGAPVTINLVSLDYENRSAVGIKKADESAEDWFSFTYQLADGEHFAILPLSTDSVGYYVTGDPIASNGYTFTVELEEGYQADSNFAVKVNGETVATAPGEITLETVSEDIRVTVEGVSKAADSTTDLIFTVDLTNAPEGMWGDIMIQDNEYNFIEETVESGKKSTAAITARNNQYTKARIYGINTDLIAGWDINGTVYPVESGKVYTDYLTIWPRGTYMQVECSSTDPVTVNIKPVLAEVPTTYTITAQQPTGGTITIVDESGNEITEAEAGTYVGVQFQAEEGYAFKNILVNGEPVIAENGFFQMPAENVTVTVVFESTAEGYFFATSADISAENGGTAVVHVKITGHSDENVTTYNAYDVTLTFDIEKLEYVGFDGAVKSDNGQVKVEGNTIRIVGCGADKSFGTEIAALTFKTKAEGAANVTISKVQVSDNDEAVTEDIPEATPKHDENDTTTEGDTTPDQSIITVPYSVNKPTFVTGNDKVLHGADYTFSYTDTTNYTYSGLKVTVGGEEVTPTEENGVYTIANVTGAVVIEVTQTANSYNVTKPETVTGPDQATYGTDYIFTVTPSEGKEIESVKATIGGEEVAVTINDDGAYVIAGNTIYGPITITVTEKDAVVPETKYTNITFSGITAEEIKGGQLTLKVEAGKEFTFSLIKAEGVTYTVQIGEEVLTANEDGSYTIPAAMMIEGDLTVTIVKAENINVEVVEYIKLDGQSMFLVTAKSAATDSVLKYGEETMYHSSKYDAYSWLVISAENAEAVKAAAETAITIAETGVTAPTVAYDCDVNGTSKVDVNDAQLAYDMYNAEYDAFTENLTMKKFLEADVDGSKNLGTQDVAAIINIIVNGAAN